MLGMIYCGTYERKTDIHSGLVACNSSSYTSCGGIRCDNGQRVSLA